MEQIDPASLVYDVFNFLENLKDSSRITLHNKVYEFWREVWVDVFTKSNSIESLDTDDFFRQHFVHALTYNNELIGCCFSTFFNLNNTFCKKLGYFSSFSPQILEDFKKSGRTMSVEYLTIHPKWRKENLDFSLGAVLVGLCLNLAKEKNTDVVWGTPRKDIKANRLASEFGFTTVKETVVKCNYECEIMAVKTHQIKRYPNTYTQEVISSLWSRRNQGPLESDQTPLKIAA